MLTVTIVRHSTNQMKICGDFTSGKTLHTGYASSCDKGAQAAKAVQMAMSHNDGCYVILAPDDVLALIPQAVRSKLS